MYFFSFSRNSSISLIWHLCSVLYVLVFLKWYLFNHRIKFRTDTSWFIQNLHVFFVCLFSLVAKKMSITSRLLYVSFINISMTSFCYYYPWNLVLMSDYQQLLHYQVCAHLGQSTLFFVNLNIFQDYLVLIYNVSLLCNCLN